MAEGVSGFLLKLAERAALWPQLLTARTDKVPLVKLDATLNTLELVP